MDKKIAGIINPGDIEGFKKSLRDVIGTSANETEIKELKAELARIRKTVDLILKKVEQMEKSQPKAPAKTQPKTQARSKPAPKKK